MSGVLVPLRIMKQKCDKMFMLVKNGPPHVRLQYHYKKLLLSGIGINNSILIGIDRHWALIEGVLILLLSSVRVLLF